MLSGSKVAVGDVVRFKNEGGTSVLGMVTGITTNSAGMALHVHKTNPAQSVPMKPSDVTFAARPALEYVGSRLAWLWVRIVLSGAAGVYTAYDVHHRFDLSVGYTFLMLLGVSQFTLVTLNNLFGPKRRTSRV